MEAEDELSSIFKPRAKNLNVKNMEAHQELKIRNSWVSSSNNNSLPVRPKIVQATIQRSSTLTYDIPVRPSNPHPSTSFEKEN